MEKVSKKPSSSVDLSRSLALRPLTGFDILEWQIKSNLSTYEAYHHLGLRNMTHYRDLCNQSTPLEPTVEILLRLNMLKPPEQRKGFSHAELFNLLGYEDALAVFKGTEEMTHAEVDIKTRYTQLFARGGARRYEWFATDSALISNEPAGGDSKSAGDVVGILLKLKDFEKPGEIFEEISKSVWALRGVDIDLEHPIPTLENPPTRKKTGRMKKATVERNVATAKLPSAKSKSAPKSVLKSTPKTTLKPILKPALKKVGKKSTKATPSPAKKKALSK
jgi:hypothetical protein